MQAAAFALLGLIACSSHRVAPDRAVPARPPGAPVEITVIGTSDLHGRLAALPLFAGYLSALRRVRPGRVVLVDAGDAFQGTLESDLGEGRAVIRAYRLVGYHALAIGNHEFDYGPEGPAAAPRGPGDDPRGALKARAREAAGAFPLLAANITEVGAPLRWENVRASAIVDLPAGVRVGIVGVTTEATGATTLAANFAGLRAGSPAEAVAREAAALRRAGAQVVVVAAHAGAICRNLDDPDDLGSCSADAEIFDVARALPAGLVDAIVAGHTHAAVAHRVNGIPVVQAYARGRSFSRVDLTFDPGAGRVVRTRIHRPTRIRPRGRYEGHPVTEDPAVAAVVAEAERQGRAKRDEPLGITLAAPVRRAYARESALGNLVSSMMLELEPRATLAFTNGGGLRADLAPGPLRYGALYDALPFENRLVLVRMTGRQVREVLARNLSSARGILCIAGARVEARCGPQGLTVDLTLTRPGRKLKDDEVVPVVTSDYLATGGSSFPRTASLEVVRDEALRDGVAARLRARGGVLHARDFFFPGARRLRLPTRRPVRCPGP
jgi:5'-nucleotidase